MKFIFLFVASLILAACDSQVNKSNESAMIEIKPEPEKLIERLEEDVRLEFEIVFLPSGKIKLQGATNLPNGANLMGSITHNSSGSWAQDKFDVENGRFERSEFSDKGNPLLDGVYLASVSMPIPAVQSQSVQEVLGQKGEYLHGPLVNEDSLGKSINLEKEFYLGENLASATQADSHLEAREAQIANRLKSEIESLLSVSEELIYLSHRGEDVACVKKMRLAHDRIRLADKEAEQLSNRYFRLKVAAGEAYVCLTCSNPDKEICDQSRESLLAAP